MLFSKIQQIAMNNKFVTWLMQFYEFIKKVAGMEKLYLIQRKTNNQSSQD